MTTGPFTRPTIAPPAPCWIVRQPPREDTIEIVYIGQANRAELDAAIERLARWPWPIDEDGSVTILGDRHADAIGIRIEHPSDNGEAFVRIVSDLFDAAIVAEANHNHYRGRKRT